MTRRTAAAAAAALSGVLLAGCAVVPPAPNTSAESTPAPTASAPAEPTIEITYQIDGRTETVLAHPDKKSCSSGPLLAFSDAEVASMVSLPAEDGDTGQIRAYVLDDLYVGFLGSGAVRVSRTGDGQSRASVMNLSGTATLVEIPEGPRPSAGELDLTTGTEVPATLTATVLCPAE